MAETHIVISVKPKYAAKIVSGQKTVELRRRTIHVQPGSRVWIYTTVPEAKITAVATVARVVTGRPDTIWRQHRDCVGISSTEFDDYFAGCHTACAIVLRDVRVVAPAVHLNELRNRVIRFQPPQFFKRLREDSPELAVLKSATRSHNHAPSKS